MRVEEFPAFTAAGAKPRLLRNQKGSQCPAMISASAQPQTMHTRKASKETVLIGVTAREMTCAIHALIRGKELPNR